MNELQLGLIGLGACAVIGVFAYNKWQESRQRKLLEQAMPRARADVLLDGDDLPPAMRKAAAVDDEPPFDDVPPFAAEPAIDREPAIDVSPNIAPNIAPAPVRVRREERVEPVLVADEAPMLPVEPVLHDPAFAAEADIAGETEVPVVNDAVMPAAVAPTPFEPVPRNGSAPAAEPARTPVATGEASADGIVSPAIDYVAAFELVEPVAGIQVLDSQRELLSRLSKPVGWAGWNERSGLWERVADDGTYRRLRVGLLLADRRGPLGEADLLTFHGAMLNLAGELLAVADMPPREPALDAAIALDHFCANVDIQIGINMISKGQPFPGTKIRALAEAAGMVLDTSGRFVRCDDDGHVLYTLANQEASPFAAETMKSMSSYGLVFILDVPCVGHGDRVFAQMLDLARRMADTLNGVLVDDNRRPLTESMLDPFRRQIGQYQSQLAAKGLPAGGPLALRLFS